MKINKHHPWLVLVEVVIYSQIENLCDRSKMQKFKNCVPKIKNYKRKFLLFILKTIQTFSKLTKTQ